MKKFAYAAVIAGMLATPSLYAAEACCPPVAPVVESAEPAPAAAEACTTEGCTHCAAPVAQAEAPDAHAGHDHAAESHEGHDHTADAAHDHAAHAGEEPAAGAEQVIHVSGESAVLHGIRTEQVRKGSVSDSTIAAPARVTYNREAIAHVSTPIEGRVEEIRVRIGDTVRKGDIMAVLHSPELGAAQSDYLEKNSEVELARVTLEIAEASMKRAESLRESQVLSEAEFVRREGEYRQARQGVLTAERQALTARNRLRLFGMADADVKTLAETLEVDPDYFLRSPLDGQVTERSASLGEVVCADDGALLVVADLSQWWVVASVPEMRALGLREGQLARVVVEGVSKEALPGRVTYIAPVVDDVTRAAQVRIEIDIDDVPLRAGMFAQVEIDTSSRVSALTVPRAAVYTVAGKPSVFTPVAGQNHVYTVRPVSLGDSGGEFIPVLAGLAEDDQIVSHGGFILKSELGKSSAKACCEH